MPKFSKWIGWTLTLGLLSGPAVAEEAVAPPPPAPPPVARSTPSPAKASKPRRPAKGRNAREKEIEGSEARNRFQADTVLKSKYQLNGEQLEVDPD